MRHEYLIVTFLLVTGLAMGCTATDESSASGPQQPGTLTAQRDKAITESKEAADAIQDYAYAKKAEFVGQMKNELVEIQKEVEWLAAKIDRTSGAVRAEAKVTLDAVRGKLVQAKERLDQAETAAESTWNDVQGRLKKSHGELKDSVASARQWLSDKIEP
jgi:gas vesicle protein